MESDRPPDVSLPPARPQPSKLLLRLALVLAAVVGFLILFKPATSIENKLQVVLDARAEAARAGDREAFQALHDAGVVGGADAWWRYHEAVFENHQSSVDKASATGVEAVFPDLDVVEATRQSDTAFALVIADGGVGAPRQILFFRHVVGDWLLTAPNPDHWCEAVVHRSLYFVWRYREADEVWVQHLVPQIDTAWSQIAADLDVALPVGLITVKVCYSFDCIPGHWDTASLRVRTPLLVGDSVEGVSETLASALVRRLGALAVGGGDETRMVGSSLLLQAIYNWEAAHVTGRDPAWVAPVLAQAVASSSLLSFDELSLIPDRASYELAAAEGYALVDYLVTNFRRGGRPLLPDLLRAAGIRSGVATALQDVLPEGTNIPALEEQWLNYLHTTYGP